MSKFNVGDKVVLTKPPIGLDKYPGYVGQVGTVKAMAGKTCEVYGLMYGDGMPVKGFMYCDEGGLEKAK